MKLERPYRHGEVIEDDPVRGFRRIWYDIDDNYGAVKTEYYATDALLNQNALERNEGGKWGDFAKVASIPSISSIAICCPLCVSVMTISFAAISRTPTMPVGEHETSYDH